MIYNNVVIRVNAAEEVPLVSEHLKELAARSKTEVGCERFDLFQSDADPQLFMLIEAWQSQATLDAHRLAPAFVDVYQTHVLPRVSRDPHLCQLLS